MTCIEINGEKTNIHFSAAHILLGHRRCGVLHGHTYTLHVRIHGDVDMHGLIIDFHMIKPLLREIAETLDHTILIPENHSHINLTDKEVILKDSNKQYVFPRQDCTFLPIPTTTVEHLAEYICTQISVQLKEQPNISSIEIGVDEGFGQLAWSTKNFRK